MDKYQKFINKVTHMSAGEIILAMVYSLRNPSTKIDMGSFGRMEDDGICYGCAATNTILHLGGFDPVEELCGYDLCPNNYEENETIELFEYAIDKLRMGDIDGYNYRVSTTGISRIPEKMQLPILDDDYTEDDLKEYESFAHYLINKYDK